MSITSIRLRRELEQPLQELADQMHRSRNWVINQAIQEFLERDTLERRRWQESLRALESVQQGEVIDADVVHTWLESWGKDDEATPPQA